MSGPLFLALPGNENAAEALCLRLGGDCAPVTTRQFPDGESYARLEAETAGRRVVLVATLSRPDEKIMPLIFAADTARELGAQAVGLVAPYLSYLRQDARFQPGEAISSRSFAKLLSRHFDWLATVDPHLHRYRVLEEIYDIPASVMHAAPLIAEWIRHNVQQPSIVGPDAESEQWVREVAQAAGAPYTVLDKFRHGDREVEVSLRDSDALAGRVPVLVDDIVASGQTMIEAARLVKSLGCAPPVCVAVHALFAGDAERDLRAEGARIVSCNTVPHVSNAIDVSDLLADGVAGFLG
jgi:ribose-phosphate pyrophosphokinase